MINTFRFNIEKYEITKEIDAGKYYKSWVD
jgi:hypothetical protein